MQFLHLAAAGRHLVECGLQLGEVPNLDVHVELAEGFGAEAEFASRQGPPFDCAGLPHVLHHGGDAVGEVEVFGTLPQIDPDVVVVHAAAARLARMTLLPVPAGTGRGKPEAAGVRCGPMADTGAIAPIAMLVAAGLFVLSAILLWADADGQAIGGMWYLGWGAFAAGAAAYVSHATGFRRRL